MSISMSTLEWYWSPGNGDRYGIDLDGTIWHVCHYTHQWSIVQSIPDDVRVASHAPCDGEGAQGAPGRR